MIFLLVFSESSFSQTNFFKGYYVKNNNDTIHGFIEYRTDWKSSIQCNYKSHIDEWPTIIKPEEIKSYSVDQRLFFESYTLKMDGKIQNRFLELLVSGEIKLYKIPYGTKRQNPIPHFYLYVKSIGKLFDLTPQKELLVIDGHTYSNTDQYSRELLKSLMDRDPEICKLIDAEKEIFMEQFLSNLIHRYNKKENVSKIYYSDLEPTRNFSLSVSFSGFERTMRFGDDEVSRFFPNDQRQSASLGLNGALFLPLFLERTQLTFATSLSKNSHYSYYEAANTFANDLFINFLLLNTEAGIMVNRITKVHFFICLGGIFALPLNVDYTWRKEELIAGSIRTELVTDAQVIPRIFGGVQVKAGKDFSIFTTDDFNLFFEYSYVAGLKGRRTNLGTIGGGIGYKIF